MIGPCESVPFDVIFEDIDEDDEEDEEVEEVAEEAEDDDDDADDCFVSVLSSHGATATIMIPFAS